MTILHSSLDAESGAASRAAVTQPWRSAPAETQALWQSAFDAAARGGATPQPADATPAAVDAQARVVGLPSPVPSKAMRVESLAAAISTDRQEFRGDLVVTDEPLLGTTGLATLTAPLAADVSAMAVASASLMDGFATFTASTTAAGPQSAPAPADRAALPGAPVASNASTAAVMVALAPAPSPMAPPSTDARVATAMPTRGAADFASYLPPVVTEASGVRRQPSLTEAQADLQEESVLVLQREHGIEIVVRHAALAPQAAVSCALATVQHLVGDRKALQQVTLNGRTVYDSGPQRPPEPARPDRAIHFSC
jgi:hypothetical protein